MLIKALIINFLHSGHTFSQTEADMKYRYLFLNNVIGFAAFVAMIMGFVRIEQANVVMGDIDLAFSVVFVLLLLRLRSGKEEIERISHALIFASYLLFTALYLLAPHQSTRLELYYLLVASAFFLKGRRIGFFWLAAIIATIAFFHLTPFFETGYSHLDVFTASLYMVALFFILNLYENVKRGQSSALQHLNANLESLAAQRTKELEAANTQLKQEKELLHAISVTDQLTGLRNRFQIREIFQKEKSRAAREGHALSAVMLDIDHFKRINDTYGHNTGDRVLQRFAGILKHSVRRYEYVMRWGGEEFLILLPQADAETAMKIARRLQATVRDTPFPGVGHPTASFGVTVCRAEDTFDTLLSRTDKALYKAKQNGRDRIEML